MSISDTSFPAFNTTGTFGAQSFTFLPETVVNAGTDNVAYWNQFTITIGGKTPLSIAPEHVNITFSGPPARIWFSPQDHPTTGIGWDESTGIMTFYVSVS
jgi:hypothetical protein